MILGVAFAAIVWIPIYGLALVLRSTVSLGLTLAVAALICALAVIGFHLAVGNTVEWWIVIFDKVLSEEIAQQIFGSPADIVLAKQSASQMMTALMAAAFFVSMVLSLLLARWWQAILYNPGGFQSEFHSYRIDKTFAIFGALILIWATVSATVGSLATDLGIVVCAFSSVAGVALIHHWVKTKNANKAWLILLYFSLAIAPQIIIIMAIVGFVDAWLNIRRFYENQTD